MQKFKAKYNRSRKFENLVMSFYQETRPESTIESFHKSGNKKWPFQFRWILLSLQNSFRSYGMLLPLLYLTGNSSITERWRYWEETKGERWIIWDGNVFAKTDTNSTRCGNVSGGKIAKQTKKLGIISDPTFGSDMIRAPRLFWNYHLIISNLVSYYMAKPITDLNT